MPFWYHGTTQSKEFAQAGFPAEPHSSESQVIWPAMQKECGSNSFPDSRFPPQCGWPPLSNMNYSVNIFARNIEDNKIMTRSGPPQDWVDTVKEAQASAECRLFGIDLRDNSRTSNPPEIQMKQITKETAASMEHESNSIQNIENSKSSSDGVQVSADFPRRELQLKHGCNTSTRTRTKVSFLQQI